MSIARKIIEVKSLCQTISNVSIGGLTNTQVKIMLFIDEYHNVSPSLLISKLGVKKSNMAKETKLLKQEQLISINKNINDKRSIEYSLTDKGKKCLDDYIKELDKIFQYEDLSIERNLDIIIDFLNKKV